MFWNIFKSDDSKIKKRPRAKQKNSNKESNKKKEELKKEIKLLQKKIEEMEYLEFKNRKKKAVKKFYTEAKKFCYGLLEEKKEKLKSIKKSKYYH
ncbi:MAG: hypothetical protein ACQERZ_02590 [Fusobacteriota bacterium]